MTPEEIINNIPVARKWGSPKLEPVAVPGWRWISGWALLTTAAIPGAWLLVGPLAAIFLPLFNVGLKTGLLAGIDTGLLKAFGFFAGLAVTMAGSQWLLLRHYIPRHRWWLLVTVLGWLTGGFFLIAGITLLANLNLYLTWGTAAAFLLVSLVVGLTQWLFLRRILPYAGWWVPITVVAYCSFLLAGRSFTNLGELLTIPLLPGVITGVGLWLLLRRSTHVADAAGETAIDEPKHRRLQWKVWLPLGLVALVAIFFIGIWIFATSNLTLAKNDGIYATPEEAVIAINSQGWGGAEVLRLDGVHATPNRRDGSQPHVWFGGARVYLDRVPRGWHRDNYSAGSYFIRVEEGWVHMPEGAMPEFIGWVMELYNLENAQGGHTE